MKTRKSNTTALASLTVKTGRSILAAINLSMAVFGATALTTSGAVYADTAVTPELTQQQAEQQTGKLIIYREKGLNANSLMYYRVAVDGESIGQLKRNTAFHLQLSPGEHVIETNDPKRSAIVFTVEENKTSYINAAIDKHWKVALQEVQATTELATSLTNCDANFKHSCAVNNDTCCSAPTKLNRFVIR